MKSEKGIALIWVIVLLVLTTFLSIGIYRLTSFNIKHMSVQGSRLDAFYIAESGIELADVALNTRVRGSNTLIDTLTERNQQELKLEHDIMDNSLNVGRVVVTINVIEEEGKDWIVVKSIGTAIPSKAKKTAIMKIDYTNHKNIVRQYE